jgi:hypothetical protein
LRVPERSPWCPGCGLPLSDAAAGRAALARIPEERRSLLGPVLFLFALTGGVAGLGLASTLAARPPNALLPLVGGLVGVAVALALRGYLTWNVPADAGLRPRVPRAGGGRAAFTGRVLADRTLEAPLSRRACVAFRVTGTSGADRVDDAEAVPFALLLDDGTRLAVQAPPARVRVATAPVPAEPGARDRLRPFLVRRGLRGDADLRLAEGTIAAGDRVRVSGAVAGGAVMESTQLELVIDPA